MEVVFDPAKDRENLRKHGVSLSLAEDFDMTGAFVEIDDREDYGEVRFNAVGFIAARLFSFTFTSRGETIRGISLRKANRRESEIYAEKS